MEYNKRAKYGDRANKAEACCKLGYPAGYYNIGKDDDGYHKMMMKKKKMEDYHDMDGYKMKGKKHAGPEGYWSI